jgi:hypothetical protein
MHMFDEQNNQHHNENLNVLCDVETFWVWILSYLWLNACSASFLSLWCLIHL